MEHYHSPPGGGNDGSSDRSSVSDLSKTPSLHNDTTAVLFHTEEDSRQAGPVTPNQTVAVAEAQPAAFSDLAEAATITEDGMEICNVPEPPTAIVGISLGLAIGDQSNAKMPATEILGVPRSTTPPDVEPDSFYTNPADGRVKDASNDVPDETSKEVPVPSSDDSTVSPCEGTQPASLSSIMSSAASIAVSEATTPENVVDLSENIVLASLPTTPNIPCTPGLASPPQKHLSQQQSAEPRFPRSRPAVLNPSPTRVHFKVKPKASIPLNLTPQEYARQCVAAAESSRLSPYALHEEEYMLLRQHISQTQLATYLNIRNGILRLWLRKPDRAVARDDAIGCAREVRWFDAASLCFDWLVRRGYINFGCVEFKSQRPQRAVSQQKDMRRRASETIGADVDAGAATDLGAPIRTSLASRRKKIVVIGAGMAGLGCARQLQNLFYQYGDRLEELYEEPPEVLVLEGRNRIGGRVYSQAFRAQPQHVKSRCTAEMGGMIVTGFDRGNPINILVRGQLGLGYHALVSTTDIYDINGQRVDVIRDNMVERLFNECLDRVSEYKFKLPIPKTVEVDHELVDEGRDSSADGRKSIAAAEDKAAAKKRAAKTSKRAAAVQGPQSPFTMPTASAKTTNSPATTPITPREEISTQVSRHPAAPTAAQKLRHMGWSLRPGVPETRDLDLDPAAKKPDATLGSVVEEAIRQYRELIELNAQDLRLLNWHIANLEYGNAINQDRLSLFGWDIDAGNEWEGKHSIIVGGYQRVPRGLMLCPTPLDVQRQMVVKKITYRCNDDGSRNTGADKNLPVTIECDGGRAIEADYVVNTIPLGVLKSGSVEFSPPLPDSKANAIARLGYGVLNKVVLTYRQVFWDPERDIFGVLRAPTNLFSLDQKEYSQRRGRMFQWFNVSEATGMPCLVALMAGDAAYDAERLSNDELVAEATAVLRSVFGAQNVPAPTEAFVTRWASDRFSRGSYSSAGPDMKIDDYDVMAQPVWETLFFAGEHTIGTHPATVHGAYLSGLRAASEVFDALVGPVHVPTPLVAPREATVPLVMKRKAALEDDNGVGRTGRTGGSEESSGNISVGSAYRTAKTRSRQETETHEMLLQGYIHSQIGRRPEMPPRVVDTSYLLFSRANYELARKRCEERRRPGQARLLPNEVRVFTSKMWRSASAEERQPYAEQAAAQKQAYEVALQEYADKAAEWDRLAADLRAVYEKEHKSRDGSVAAGGTVRSASSGSHSASGPAGATPTRQSPFGGWHLRQKANYQGEGTADVDMATKETPQAA